MSGVRTSLAKPPPTLFQGFQIPARWLGWLRQTLGHQDMFFAAGLVVLVAVLVLPMPTWLVDIGLSASITLSVLILMVAIWIEKPLDFSSFPTVLLVATLWSFTYLASDLLYTVVDPRIRLFGKAT